MQEQEVIRPQMTEEEAQRLIEHLNSIEQSYHTTVTRILERIRTRRLQEIKSEIQHQ